MLRLAVDGAFSRPVVVRTRDVVLDAVGDVNLGDGVPTSWPRAGRCSRGATSRRSCGAPTSPSATSSARCPRAARRCPKKFNFRGSPRALREVVRFAGLDVLNLANNHAGDYGMRRAARHACARSGPRARVPVGAGATWPPRARPQVVTRLGLRIAFVGFSDIGPPSFFAGPRRRGPSFATSPAIRAGVRAARAARTSSSPPSTGASSAHARERAAARVRGRGAAAPGPPR